MNKTIKSVVMVLGIGIFSLIPESLSAVEWSATWTGAENGFWTNANNWVDGQVGGRWLVKDAGGNLVTNGVKGSTAYFGAEGASGATAKSFTILKVTGTATGALPTIDPATPVPPAWQLYWAGSALKLGVPRATRLYFR